MMAEQLCQCGCGRLTTIASKTDASTNRIKGEPMRFIRGHSERGKVKSDYFMERVKDRRREKNPNWNGGLTARKQHTGSYIFVLQPGHPRADGKGYVRRALLVAEDKLGRQLYPGEVTHHINGIKEDDRPENVEVFPGNGKHIHWHHEMRQGAKE